MLAQNDGAAGLILLYTTLSYFNIFIKINVIIRLKEGIKQ